MRLQPPTYKVVGNLDYLLNRDASTWSPQFDFSPWDVADGHNLYSEYNLRITSHGMDVEKCIEFKAVGAHARGAQPPTSGSATIHRNLLEDLRDERIVYVITEVVLASYVKLSVRIGSETANFVYGRDMPIGFKYKKYKLSREGTFVRELNTTLRVHEHEAIWLEPSPQPVPTVPEWDLMRRRLYDGEVRKRRSTLTLPTLHGTPERVLRRPRDADNLDNANPQIENNGAVVHGRDVVQANNFLRGNWSNPAIPQNHLNAAARRSVSMEAIRGSDDEEE